MNHIIRNALEYDAVACAAAEGHDSILQYLLSQGRSPNGTHKVVNLNTIIVFAHLACYVPLT